MIKKILIRAIEYYQKKGGGQYWFNVDCCFEPSCSEYCRQALQKYGLWRGLAKGLQRIRRCKDRNKLTRTADPL